MDADMQTQCTHQNNLTHNNNYCYENDNHHPFDIQCHFKRILSEVIAAMLKQLEYTVIPFDDFLAKLYFR